MRDEGGLKSVVKMNALSPRKLKPALPFLYSWRESATKDGLWKQLHNNEVSREGLRPWLNSPRALATKWYPPPSLPETSEKFSYQATNVSVLPNKLQIPQESSFCEQYLLLDINTSFQSLKFISIQMMFMTLGLVILSWILSAKETGLAHGSRHLWLWSEPLFKEYWGQMELIYPQVDERLQSRKATGLAERTARTKEQM